MTSTWISNLAPILQVLTSLTTLVTILFVWRQTRNNSTSTISQLYKDIAEHMLTVDKIFIEHPNLRPYFYSNKSPDKARSTEECEQIQSIAEIILDFFDLLWVLKDISRKYKTHTVFQSHIAEWDDYFLDVYKTSPALQDFFHEHEDWWSEEMIAFFKSAALKPNK